MKPAATISHARHHLPKNPTAYARVMSGAIRSAMSARTAAQFRAAIAEDNAAAHFDRLDTSCPVARSEANR